MICPYLWTVSSSALRILSIIPYKVFPAIMGGQKGIALFYKYLSQQVDLRCLTTKKNEATDDVCILPRLSNASARYINPLVYVMVKNILKEEQCGYLLAEHPYYAWLIWLVRKTSSIHVIVHSHNIESERFRSIGKWWWRILWYYERWAYRAAHVLWFKTKEDADYAIHQYGIPESRCHVIPYGVETTQLPSSNEIQQARQRICQLHQIPKEHCIILFNGTLSYGPNLNALHDILDGIAPALAHKQMPYTMVICGKGLPAEMKELSAYTSQHIVYAGFVEDIDLYFKACDIFLNPLTDGGGIKTKLVEALGFGKKCVSSTNGAIGVEEPYTSGRLRIAQDGNWDDYANKIVALHQEQIDNDNNAFYQQFSWIHIAHHAVNTL